MAVRFKYGFAQIKPYVRYNSWADSTPFPNDIRTRIAEVRTPMPNGADLRRNPVLSLIFQKSTSQLVQETVFGVPSGALRVGVDVEIAFAELQRRGPVQDFPQR